MIYLWLFFFACLIGGIITVIIGFNNFGNPFKSKNWFFIGGISFLAPMVITLIILSAYISPGLFIPEILLLFVLLFGRFGVIDDGVSRNTSLVCAIILFIQLLILMFFFTMMMVMMDPSRGADYDKKFNDFGYKEVAGQIAISAYWGHDKNVEFPSAIDGKSVTSINNSAFSNNNFVTSITIPDSVTSLGDRAFNGCGKLKSIWVSRENPVYSSDEGMLYNKEKTTLITCPVGKTGTVALPDGVTSIDEGAFANSSLTSITIPEGVTSIDNSVFSYCTSLTSITIPDSVTSIGVVAFLYCDNLVIHCSENSYAHRYAVENEIEFVLDE